MTLHIDLYKAMGGVPGYWEFYSRQFEGPAAVNYAVDGPGAQKGLPYFNGYTLQTALHDDIVCDAHKPQDPVWKVAGENIKYKTHTEYIKDLEDAILDLWAQITDEQLQVLETTTTTVVAVVATTRQYGLGT